MSDSSSFARLLSRIRGGDRQRAAEIVVQRYAARLAALAARKMSPRLQQRISPEDVAQSVLATFLRQVDVGQLEVRDWQSLWGLLARIAVWRICRHADRHAAARRAQSRETPLEEAVEALDREPSPDDVLIARELCDQLFQHLPEKHRPILRLIFDGATQEQIAKELGTSLSTIDRVLRRVRKHLSALIAQEEAE